MLSLPSQEPRRYLYDLLPLYPLRPGKGVRPVLCMAACSAYGGTYERALPFAVALELLHNAFLVLDDLQDDSPSRRGRPALHVAHGMPLAVNVGNALAARANAKVLRAAEPLRPRAVGRAVLDGWERMTRETIEGQALDLGWTRDNVVDLSVSDYLLMCAKKTSWYTAIQPLAMGAILGSGDSERQRDTFRFGWFLGVLFQIVNDLDGVQASGDGNDIEEGKRTILIVHLLGALAGAERAELLRIMGLPREERGAEQVAWVLGQMERARSLAYARECVRDLAAAAQEEAETAFGRLPSSEARDMLLSITSYILERAGLGELGARQTAGPAAGVRLTPAPGGAQPRS